MKLHELLDDLNLLQLRALGCIIADRGGCDIEPAELAAALGVPVDIAADTLASLFVAGLLDREERTGCDVYNLSANIDIGLPEDAIH